MKAKAIFWTNSDEVETAEKLSLPNIPECKYDSRDFYFKIDDISHFYIADSGDVIIYIFGQKWAIEFDKDLWQKLIDKFQN